MAGRPPITACLVSQVFTHPYKGINICRSCRASSDYLQTVFSQYQWTIPDDFRPARCSGCRCFHTKPSFVNRKRIDYEPGRRHLCSDVDCTDKDKAYEKLGIHKSDPDFVPLHGPHLHPDHVHMKGFDWLNQTFPFRVKI